MFMFFPKHLLQCQTQHSTNIHLKINYGYRSPVISINVTPVCVIRRNTEWTATYHVHYKLVIKITCIFLLIFQLLHKVFCFFIPHLPLICLVSSLPCSFSAHILGPSLEHYLALMITVQTQEHSSTHEAISGKNRNLLTVRATTDGDGEDF
uniref:Uncharacterized protein n=1 Tax=Molossus molossus TaxID=27622 RepID=A0A7J8DTJ3_MOLMO|nr:hypothetical protein HJG59_009118 [Molossus molossus]